MKISPALFTLVFVLLSSIAFSEAIAPRPSVPALSGKHQSIFVFKVGRKFKGALVEVYYSNGDFVGAKALAKRKMTINFCAVRTGTYTIRVIKNNLVEEFTYSKK